MARAVSRWRRQGAEVWRMTSHWRIRTPRCGQCGKEEPEKPCGNPCMPEIPF